MQVRRGNGHMMDTGMNKLVSKQTVKLPEPTDTCEMWRAYFHKQYGNAKIYNAFSLEEVCIRAWGQLNSLADAWEPTIRSIYDIQVSLYVMQLCDALAGSKASTYDFYLNADYYFKRIVKHTQDQLEAAVHQIDVERAQDRYSEHLKELAAYVNGLCEKGSSKYLQSWFGFYKLLWSHLFNEKGMVEQEAGRLRQLLSDSRADHQVRQAAILGIMHLDISQGEDENAWERAETLDVEVKPAHWFDYLKTFIHEGQWERLLQWLRWLRPLIEKDKTVYTWDFLELWDQAALHREVDQEHRKAMISLLPTSFPHYANFLLRKEEYQAWADLCLLLDLSPVNIDVSQLKIVEKANARCLLPIYHHAIETCIQGKNRADYVQAAKLLKKLAAAYKKLKMTPRFDGYLQQLVQQYARYRAFHEELRRGGFLL